MRPVISKLRRRCAGTTISSALTVVLEAFVRGNEHTHPHRIDERHVGEVDAQVARAGGMLGVDLLAEPPGVHEVEVAARS